jgi:putative transposase
MITLDRWMLSSTATELRQNRGKAISLVENAITRLHEFEYYVRSQSKEKKEYRVFNDTKGWTCTCPDFNYRRWTCKHIYAVQFSQGLRKEVKQYAEATQPRTLSPIQISQCQFCGSQSIKKFGIRKNKSGDIQRYVCDDCKRTFSVNIGFERMKHNPQAITTAMQLYFSGESLRNTQKSLRLLGVQVCHRTVYKWIRKYSELMTAYADKINPSVSDTWRADEIYVKVKGTPKYLFALMDDETRYWIAQEVANTKEGHDASTLFSNAKEIAGKEPVRMITDGLHSYEDAHRKVFGKPWNRRYFKVEHVREIQLDGKIHNNKMERMNGEIRDREKTMRGLKTTETPILKGYQVFHNFIRPHEALKGLTPSEACGIWISGENKWKTLIENASFNRTETPKAKLEEFDQD